MDIPIEPQKYDEIRKELKAAFLWHKERGATQTVIAANAGMTQPQFSDYMRGKTNPEYETLQRLASVLGYDLPLAVDLRLVPRSKSDP